MKHILKLLFLLTLCFSVTLTADAQRKKGKNRRTEIVTPTTEPKSEDTFDDPVERITFIDSLITDKHSLLQDIMLTKEAGSIVPASTFLTKIPQTEQRFSVEDGATAYINAFGNQAYLALIDSTGNPNLYTSIRTGDQWSTPSLLEGLSATGIRYSHPFLMPDGVTLYYSAEEPTEGLGGKDIFVTRYNPQTRSFLTPERLGRPFCSESDDYMFAIDELSGIGLFVTNRHLAGDSLCIYYFIPAERHEYYDPETTDARTLRQAAEIHSIAATQWDEELVREHRRLRLRALETASAAEDRFCFVVDDTHVCHHVSDFKTATARRILPQWLERQKQLEEAKVKLDQMRRRYAKARQANLITPIKEQEKLVSDLGNALSDLARNIRKAEKQ